MSATVLHRSRGFPDGDYLPEVQTAFGDLAKTDIVTRIRKFFPDSGEHLLRRECLSGQPEDDAETPYRQLRKTFTALVAAFIESCRTEIQTDATRSRQISQLAVLSPIRKEPESELPIIVRLTPIDVRRVKVRIVKRSNGVPHPILPANIPKERLKKQDDRATV